MRIPLATYRLQFGPSFTFRDARALIPYLSALGISDVYASPILKATPGSTHGYDVTDPDRLNPDLGTREDFQALVSEVHAHGMGWVQDIVPNHMAYASDNCMLMDVFESGPRSPFYTFFDIFRDHPDPELRTKLLAPFLGGPLEDVLRRGDIKLVLDDQGLGICYFDRRFPLHLSSYAGALWHDNTRAVQPPPAGKSEGSPPRATVQQTGGDLPCQAFSALHDTFTRLSGMDDSPEKRRRLMEAKKLLLRLHQEEPTVRVYIDGVLESFHRLPDGPIEQSPLYVLLDQQVFKLAPWQVAHETINYRRFFYLSEFIALRVQNPAVFERTHRKVFELLRAGVFTGLRIDHVDGLYNPKAYLTRLRDTLTDCYLVVEKILELYEFLPAEWPIQGTSGYKFCNHVNGVFCRCENEDALTRIYHEFIGSEPDYDQLLYDEKKKVLSWRMAGEVTYLAYLAGQLCGSDEPRATETMRKALTALMAAFPVYRTYVDAHSFREEDRAVLTDAIGKARDKCPECRTDVDRLVELLLSDPRKEPNERVRQARQHLLMRFQQFTGPAMAKGFEDTLLYVYNPFVSLNEVGGDPSMFGVPLDRFHLFNERRAQSWPHAMSATSTHDSKRGEDVRARLNVLSEIPQRWRQAVTRWADMNERHKQRCDDSLAPSRNDEYLLYQTMVGALPFEQEEYDGFTQRLKDYMVKVVREAKTHGNWVHPNEPYEHACLQFIDSILDHSAANPFWMDFVVFQKQVADYGIYNSLSQTVLKITCPGVPDFYQGSDLWDLNLVDPDNRRPVDFAKRSRLLEGLLRDTGSAKPEFLRDLMDGREDGRIKLFVILKGLQARREHQDLFENGEYVPASVTGSRSAHVIAFFRRRQDAWVLAVAPRFLTFLVQAGDPPMGAGVWGDTRIRLPADAPSDWRDTIAGNTLTTSNELSVGEVLSEFPVSILVAGPHARPQV